MKKHFIVGLLFLNVICGIQAITSPILSPDAFTADLNCTSEEEYVPQEQSVFEKMVFAVAERIPDPVMFACVVAYCKYAEYKQRAREKFNFFIACLCSKLSCRCIDEQDEQQH